MSPSPTLSATTVALLALGLSATVLHDRTGLAPLPALGALACWAAVVVAAEAWPRRASLCARTAGSVLTGWILVRPWRGADGRILGVSDDHLGRLVAGLASAALILGVLALYQGQAHRIHPDERLPWLRRLTGVVAVMTGLVATALAVFLWTRWPLLVAVRNGLTLFVAALLLEPLLVAAAGWFKADPGERWPSSRWESPLLGLLAHGTRGLGPVQRSLERQLGHPLREAALLQPLRQSAPAALLFVTAGVVASLSVSVVPIGHQGVQTRLGTVLGAPLPPGLHWHLPWPLSQVASVDTARIHELSLGFDQDLAGPVLWNEAHFSGEQNLLLGDGDELITVNVAIQFRVRDPREFLQRTRDPARAVRMIGERELLAVTAGRDGFTLMTTARTGVASELHARLQRASDELGLGLEIMFVGLKDVHPPVPVAGAFQAVVSAEEQRHALVDRARADQVETAAAARADDARLRVRADTSARERVLRARGESARFAGPLEGFLLSPAATRTRLRLEAVEEGLSRARRIQLVPTSASGSALRLWLGSPPSDR